MPFDVAATDWIGQIKTSFAGNVKTVVVPLVASDTAGGVFAWANPEPGAIVVREVVIDVTTKSTGACTLDIGTTTVSAATLSDNLIDGADVGTAVITTDNIKDASTNGKPLQRLAAAKWVTASMASGATAGLVGNAYIRYFVL